MNRFTSLLIILSFIGLMPVNKSYATHAKAGEIIYRQIGNANEYKYQISVIYYTETSSPANRDNVDIYFGDNTKENVPYEYRISVGVNISKTAYTTVHVYPGPGEYIISFFDPNRVDGIRNMYGSVYTPFYVETTIQINKFTGKNSSPVLLQMPIDFAEINKVYVHNPGAYDPDGDSLVFRLTTPKQDVGVNVVDYYMPYGKNGFTLDPYTGDIVWDYPDTLGIVNIAFLIEEYRNGVRIGYIVRDMQIIVEKGINNPPRIDPISDTCIEAGKSLTLSFPVKAKDLDAAQTITLTANGGTFNLPVSPSVLTPKTASGKKIVTATFTWTPNCNHIRKEPYSVVIKAIDDYDLLPLADLEHFFIKVVGPAPRNLKIYNTLKGIYLDWDKPGICNNVKGYNVYRKADSSFWDTSLCETGIPSYTNFKKIATILKTDSTGYFDDNGGSGLIPGVTYCYRITAIYLSEGNFEPIEGYSSMEVCGRQQKDLPVITHVSITKTSTSSGEVYLDWSKPTQLDTILYKGPYKNVVYKSINNSAYIAYKVFNSPTFYGLKDTVFIDTFQNTQANKFNYYIEFYSTNGTSDFLLGKAQSTSSIFLEAIPSHKSIILSWNEKVPWYNDYYIIYKKNKLSGLYDSIGVSTKKSFTDTGLFNGENYCYKVKSYGYYTSGEGFVFPILNYSEEVCTFPVDTLKPCPPELMATAICDEMRTELKWTYSDSSCAKDVVGYKIYYSKFRDNNFSLIANVSGYNVRDYNDNRVQLQFSLAGCYKITAIDSFGNESNFSIEVCVDNCPEYILPNVFSPNGDGINDLIKPLSGNKYIDRVNMVIFNRWGQIVYETFDPQINWDGKDYETNIDCSEGTYYYICDVYQLYLEGAKMKTLHGTITLFR